MAVNPLSLVVKLPGVDVPVKLFKRAGSSFYWARFSLRTLGQQRIGLKTADLRAAKDKAREKVEEASRPVVETYTLRAAKAEFFAAGGHGAGVGARTRSGYHTVLKQFGECAGVETDLSALDTDGAVGLVRAYLKKLADAGHVACTLHNHIKALAVFFREVMLATGPNEKLRTLWAFNPGEKQRHKLPKMSEPKRSQISPEERAALLAAAPGYACWPAVVLCLGAGLRPAEACATDWKDVEFFPRPLSADQARRNHYGTVGAYSYKTKKRRTVPLTAFVANALAALPGRSGRILSVNKYNAFRSLRAVKKNASLKGVTFQAMRRTFASELSQKLPRNVYARIMGHDLATGERHYIKSAEALNDLDFSALA